MATRTKEKAAARKANADKRPQAHARFVRISPRKVKIVIDLIRGKNVDEALAILQFTPKAASPIVMKVLNSAIANAVNNQELNRQNLYVAEVYANPGPTLKRYVASATLPAAAAAHPRCSSAPATSAWCWTRSKAKEEKTWVRK